MILLKTSLALLVLIVLNIIREPRSFWNALFLLADLCLLFLGTMLIPELALFATLAVLLLPLIFFATTIYLIINGLIMLKREGRSLPNTLSLITGALMGLGAIGTLWALIAYQDRPLIMYGLSFVIIAECYLAFTFIALLIYSLLYTLLPKRMKCDYVIVHGCGLKNGREVTPLLKGRLDKAVKVYERCKVKPKLVLSGGRGSDEKVSEARAMANYLKSIGFPADEVILEERSTTTFENLREVRDLLDVDGQKHRYIFVTNNYHVYRTGLFARKLKMKAEGVGCRTARYYWPSAFLREYIAVLFQYKWLAAALAILWGVVVLLLQIDI